MRILGIDPGTNIMGFAVIDIVKKNKITVQQIGILKLGGYEKQSDKLTQIFNKVHHLVTQYCIDELAIEAPFYGKNAQSMLKLGRAQGAAMAAASSLGLEVNEYAPKAIKLAITGNGTSSKEQVAHLLKSIVTNPFDAITMDASDALGVAVCHYYRKTSSLGHFGGKNDWSSFLKNNPDRVL